MDCEEIKKIIPRYFNHTASEEEIKIVEEHLCLCHECRTTLGELMDKLSEPEEAKASESQSQGAQPLPKEVSPEASKKGKESGPQPEEKPEEKIEEVQPSTKGDMEYFPGKDLESLMEESQELSAEEEPKEEETIEPLPPEKQRKFSLKEDVSPPLDKTLLSKDKLSLLEYASLAGGVIVLGSLLFLLLKG